eukprot:345659-Chlamydomonas_euryale.AAC.1
MVQVRAFVRVRLRVWGFCAPVDGRCAPGTGFCAPGDSFGAGVQRCTTVYDAFTPLYISWPGDSRSRRVELCAAQRAVNLCYSIFLFTLAIEALGTQDAHFVIEAYSKLEALSAFERHS